MPRDTAPQAPQLQISGKREATHSHCDKGMIPTVVLWILWICFYVFTHVNTIRNVATLCHNGFRRVGTSFRRHPSGQLWQQSWGSLHVGIELNFCKRNPHDAQRVKRASLLILRPIFGASLSQEEANFQIGHEARLLTLKAKTVFIGSLTQVACSRHLWPAKLNLLGSWSACQLINGVCLGF